MSKKSISIIISLLLFNLVLNSCSLPAVQNVPVSETKSSSAQPAPTEDKHQPPPVLDTPTSSSQPVEPEPAIEKSPSPAESGSIPRSTPEESGMDSELLAEMLEIIKNERHRIDSVIILREGELVLEAYVPPFEKDHKHNLFSITKSVLSALVGIAIEEGFLENLDQPVLDFFPGKTIKNLDERKSAMTLEHLITMTTGLQCRDSYLYGNKGLREMSYSDDWVQFVLDLPMEVYPGEKFEYCNGASLLLSAALQGAVGKTTAEFAHEILFEPLGIKEFEWDETPNGITFGWSRLHLSPLDIARIGQLYLNEGQWDSKQLVPKNWIKTSTRQHIPGTLQDGYGYGWWIASPQMYMGLGYRGQFLIIRPEEKMVVVFNSDLEEQDFYLPQQLFETYILPSLKNANSPLAPNPDGYNRLQAAVEDLAAP